MKFVRFQISIWSVEESIDNGIVSIAKVEYIDLEGGKFNDFAKSKLEIIKKLIDEI